MTDRVNERLRIEVGVGKELENRQYGVIKMGEVGGRQMEVLWLRDRVGEGRVALPVSFTQDNEAELRQILSNMDYESGVEMDIGGEAMKNLSQLMEVMPPLLAVHAGINMGIKAEEDEIGQLIQEGGYGGMLYGVIGGPHSGKTMVLLVEDITNLHGPISVVDGDPFSPQSITFVKHDFYQRALREMGERIWEDERGLAQIIDEIYHANNEDPGVLAVVKDTKATLTIRSWLDKLVKFYAATKDKDTLIDLGGEDKDTVHWDAFKLLRWAIPTISLQSNLGEENDGKKLTEVPFRDRMMNVKYGNLLALYTKIRINIEGEDRLRPWWKPEEELAMQRGRKDWEGWKQVLSGDTVEISSQS